MQILLIGGTDAQKKAATMVLANSLLLNSAKVVEVPEVKVAINVLGGVVQGVIANTPMSVDIVDHDNEAEDGQEQANWDALQQQLQINVV